MHVVGHGRGPTTYGTNYACIYCECAFCLIFLQNHDGRLSIYVEGVNIFSKDYNLFTFLLNGENFGGLVYCRRINVIRRRAYVYLPVL